MTMPRTVPDEATHMRAIVIDPWAKSVVPAQVQACERGCGCWDADAEALVELLGRWQKAYAVLDGTETLLVGVGVVAPSWTWAGSIQVKGYGVLLGGSWSHAFSDSRASVDDVLACIAFPRRRVTAEAA
jgi:hypothetical protein